MSQKIKELESKQAEASNRFWLFAAGTAISVTVFTASAIMLDIGVTTMAVSSLEILTAASAITSIGSASLAQSTSNKIDVIESEIDQEKRHQIELTTAKEVAPKQHDKPLKTRDKEHAIAHDISNSKHAEAAASNKEKPSNQLHR